MKNLKCLAIIALMLGGVHASSAQIQVSRGLSLSLTTEYGFGEFRECRREVTFNSKPVGGSARPAYGAIQCVHAPGSNLPPLIAGDLTVDEDRRLATLLEDPGFWIGQSVGTDQRRRDGVFERLEVRGGDFVGVLVTSGNPSFRENIQRRDFLALMNSIEDRLKRQASQTP